MPPLRSVETYRALWFRDQAESEEFVEALRRFVGSPAGNRYLTDAPRAVLWQRRAAAPDADRQGDEYLYASDGALLAAYEAGHLAMMGRMLTHRELPEGCLLRIGLPEDWPPDDIAAPPAERPSGPPSAPGPDVHASDV